MTRLTVNGVQYDVEAPAHESLADVLHDRLHLIGTRVSCGEGECGCCTVLLNGVPATACLIMHGQVEGAQIRTVEGLGSPGSLSALQQAFIDEHGFQCAFCTSGFLMSAAALLNEEPNPSRSEVEDAVSGNLCRCGAYPFIVESILTAAQRIREQQ
jgi:aerobic-type carbon monoxide dehydrogenase small subunit (CoxS/CutS family)